jgi:hypothetical protein
MAHSIEENASRLLKTLRLEEESGKTLQTVSPLHEILTALDITEANERNQTVDFLARARAIRVVNTADRGRFALPSDIGLEMLKKAEYKSDKRTGKKRDRRLQIWIAAATAIFGAAVTIGLAFCGKR